MKMKTLTYKVKEEVIEKLLDLNSAFDLYEQKEIIDVVQVVILCV